MNKCKDLSEFPTAQFPRINAGVGYCRVWPQGLPFFAILIWLEADTTEKLVRMENSQKNDRTERSSKVKEPFRGYINLPKSNLREQLLVGQPRVSQTPYHGPSELNVGLSPTTVQMQTAIQTYLSSVLTWFQIFRLNLILILTYFLSNLFLYLNLFPFELIPIPTCFHSISFSFELF